MDDLTSTLPVALRLMAHPMTGLVGLGEGDRSTLVTAADEIERLRAAGSYLKQALLVTSNVWGQHHTTEGDAKYHLMVDKAVDAWQEARRG